MEQPLAMAISDRTPGETDFSPMANPTTSRLGHASEPSVDKKDREAVQASVVRGCPFRSDSWQEATAKQLGLESTFRLRGRPKIAIDDSKSYVIGLIPVSFLCGTARFASGNHQPGFRRPRIWSENMKRDLGLVRENSVRSGEGE